jgi:hypothetical protein
VEPAGRPLGDGGLKTLKLAAAAPDAAVAGAADAGTENAAPSAITPTLTAPSTPARDHALGLRPPLPCRWALWARAVLPLLFSMAFFLLPAL